MRRPVVRFALACLLFLGWMGYLIYLAVTASHPDVVSRPQVLVADLVVAARIDNLDGDGVVEEVLFVKDGLSAPEVGKPIQVGNLRHCKRLARDGEDPDQVPLDWQGPGVYLLLLGPHEGKTWYVVGVPPSPGYPPAQQKPTPRLYPRTDETLRQVRGKLPDR